MSTVLPRQTIKQLGLEDKELVRLYLELIRIIEKDIDELKAGDTKSGWTSWAIIGGILGALLLLLGETRRLLSFPTEDVKAIGLTALLLYLVTINCMGAFTLHFPDVRPGRLRWSNDAFFSSLPRVVYRFVVFAISVVVALSLSLAASVRTVTAITFGLWTLWAILALIYAKLKYPLGNNKATRTGGYLTLFVTFVTSAVALVLLGTNLPVPVGETGTLPYILAGFIVTIICLGENLISSMAPSRLLSNLQDLRNDVLFLRVDIDEALRRYELLTEGETLPDALQKDLSEIANELNLITYTHSNMSGLLGKMYIELPLPGDAADMKKQKLEQMRLLRDSHSLHESKYGEISEGLKGKLKKFSRKSALLRVATDDAESESNIRSVLQERLQLIGQVESQLARSKQRLEYYASHPSEIPEEMLVEIKTIRERLEQPVKQSSDLN
jgi:hypothetical protein